MITRRGFAHKDLVWVYPVYWSRVKAFIMTIIIIIMVLLFYYSYSYSLYCYYHGIRLGIRVLHGISTRIFRILFIS